METPHIKCASWCWPFKDSLHFLRIHFPPSFETTKPRYTNSCYMNIHFFRFINSFSSFKHYSISLTCSTCFVLLLLKISISSKYTTTNLPKNGFKTSFINLMNVLGALVNLEWNYQPFKNPSFILNVAIHSSPSLI
jgi:hypothetical protein